MYKERETCVCVRTGCTTAKKEEESLFVSQIGLEKTDITPGSQSEKLLSLAKDEDQLTPIGSAPLNEDRAKFRYRQRSKKRRKSLDRCSAANAYR